VIPSDETFEGTWPFAPRFSTAPGFRMHYVDEGIGQTVICLHGEPTWGYLYRKFIPALAQHYRVIVPDHMGFGKSETPQDRVYTLRTHVENFTALVEDLDLSDITLVGQDWGGPIASSFALRHAHRVKRICFLNSGVPRSRREPDRRLTPWFVWIKKHHDAGTLREVLGHLDSNILSVMKIIGFQNSAAITDTWIRAYAAPFQTAQDCIGAIEFPLDALLQRNEPFLQEVSGYDAIADKPAMLAVGMKDYAIDPDRMMAGFRNIWPAGPIVQLPNAGHFCQEDAPETLTALIHQFIQLT
jgi:haloalkane dehalogenase